MSNPQNPNDPKDATRPEHRTDPSRKGQGPDNPLPGEPGGPSTSGHAEPSKPAKEPAKDQPREPSKR